jgi:nucleotide-binding universal stress UspA family protein
MTNVLVPADFSENAYNALRYATELFKKELCTFYILNVFQTGISDSESKLFKIAKEASEKELAKVVNRIKGEQQNPEHVFKAISLPNSLPKAIGKTVLDHSIRFVIMGTQGASGLKGVFMGSNTVDIISKIDFCPIIAVPANYRFAVPKELLFATGYEHVYDKYELRPMLRLAKLWNSKIRVLHIKTAEKESPQKTTAKKTLTERLGDIPFEIVELNKKDKIATQIRAQVEAHESIGMVSIIDYWHSFLEKLTHEAVVKNMAFQTTVPLLVLPLPK